MSSTKLESRSSPRVSYQQSAHTPTRVVYSAEMPPARTRRQPKSFLGGPFLIRQLHQLPLPLVDLIFTFPSANPTRNHSDFVQDGQELLVIAAARMAAENHPDWHSEQRRVRTKQASSTSRPLPLSSSPSPQTNADLLHHCSRLPRLSSTAAFVIRSSGNSLSAGLSTSELEMSLPSMRTTTSSKLSSSLSPEEFTHISDTMLPSSGSGLSSPAPLRRERRGPRRKQRGRSDEVSSSRLLLLLSELSI